MAYGDLEGVDSGDDRAGTGLKGEPRISTNRYSPTGYNAGMNNNSLQTDQLFIDKVLRARRADPVKKFLAAARMYEYKRSIMMAAIRAENPHATPEEQRAIYQRRLKIARLLEKC